MLYNNIYLDNYSDLALEEQLEGELGYASARNYGEFHFIDTAVHVQVLLQKLER